MKKPFIIFVLSFIVASACDRSDDPSGINGKEDARSTDNSFDDFDTESDGARLLPPQIAVDMSPVWAGEQIVSDDVPAKEFSLMVYNEGDAVLHIESAVIRGDEHCAFTMTGPAKTTLAGNQVTSIRIAYKPTYPGYDNVSLVILSDSQKYSTFEIPMCGRGISSEGTSDTEDSPVICAAVSEEQPDCER